MRKNRKFVFGNERFGGSYTPGEFEINFPDDMSREEFEEDMTQVLDILEEAFYNKTYSKITP